MISNGTAPGNLRNRALNGGAPPGWRDVHPTSVPCTAGGPREPVILDAIVSTWFDADVIGATVLNCFAQGCRRVYILDNASPDNTIEVAQDAGAIIARVYVTEKYDDDYRCALQNEIAGIFTRNERLPNHWWLMLDADELPVGPGGRRLVDCLAEVPVGVTTVGANFVDLYPTSADQYVVGRHPAACMPFGSARHGNVAGDRKCVHWKHPLLRFRYGLVNLAMIRGNHRPAMRPPCPPVFEPDWSLTVFHAPFRREVHARERLDTLCGGGRSSWDDDVTHGHGAIRRWRSLDAIYSQRWHDVEIPHTQVFGRPITGLPLYPWRTLAPDLAHLFPDRP